MTTVGRALLPVLFAFAASSASADTVRIYVTNSAGDSIHVIDPATNKVVQEIKGIEAAHGVGFAPDGSRVYASNEADSTLDVFDRKSGKLIKKVPLSNHPNNIAVTKDGSRVVVGIARDPGALDVIDTATLTLKKSIPVNGRLHNVYVTPDGKHVITGSIRSKTITVIDVATEEPVWALVLDKGVRPMTIEAGPDGATRRIFVQLSDLNGFAVVDFAERKEVARIELPKTTTEFATDARSRHLAVARHGRLAGRQDPVGHQHSQQRRVRLCARRPAAHRPGRAAGPPAARPRPDRLGAELGHVHARRQDPVRVHGGAALGLGDRHQDDEADRQDPGGRGAQAHQHDGDPERRQALGYFLARAASVAPLIHCTRLR